MIWTKEAHQSAKFQIFDCSPEILPNLYFYRFLLLKVSTISAKKVQRNYVSWHWRVMRNLRENWLVLPKMTWGIWQIFTRALESLKFRILMGSFIESRKCMTLKFTGELYVMTMKNNAKFEEELTCQFKIDMRNLTNFDPST